LNGRTIRYLETGRGRTVLLLHGFACDHTDWRYQIPLLAKRHRVIAPDLAYFGQSDPGERPHTTVNHAKDCLRLMDHLGVRKAVLVGHSMGGWIARDIYLRAPDRVEGIVEVDNTAVAPALDQLPKILNVHRPSGKEYSSAVNDKRREKYLACRREMAKRFGAKNPGKAVYKSSPEGKWCAVPVLVIWTSRGAFSRDAIPQGWVPEHFPSSDAHLAIIRDSGHWPMLERPEQVNEALLNFLGDLP
jgi:pimeloyl-ACP methyl ester carboxylesterase